jgi:retron-type reverse transcriptase
MHNQDFADRITDRELLKKVTAHFSDKDQLTWLGMMALAKDIYSRSPDGSYEFRDLVKTIGVSLRDVNGNLIDIKKFFDADEYDGQ